MKKTFDYTDCISWNNPEKEFALAAKAAKVYIVTAAGWYFPTNIIKIFTDYKEALSFLGFNSEEEYLHYVNTETGCAEGFYYYRIEKFDFVKAMDDICAHKTFELKMKLRE